MILPARGGTDGANIVLFWPDNLPDDADALLESEPIEFVEREMERGHLVWFPCEGDGTYSVLVFLDEEIPDDLKGICTDEETIPKLIVRGSGYFGGMECMFKQNDKFIQKYPGMCERIEIPEGTYSARIYLTNITDDLSNAWLISKAGQGAKRLWHLHGNIMVLLILSAITTVVLVFMRGMYWRWSLAVLGLLALIAWLISRTRPYKQVRLANEEFDRSYPSYVLHLIRS